MAIFSVFTDLHTDLTSDSTLEEYLEFSSSSSNHRPVDFVLGLGDYFSDRFNPEIREIFKEIIELQKMGQNPGMAETIQSLDRELQEKLPSAIDGEVEYTREQTEALHRQLAASGLDYYLNLGNYEPPELEFIPEDRQTHKKTFSLGGINIASYGGAASLGSPMPWIGPQYLSPLVDQNRLVKYDEVEQLLHLLGIDYENRPEWASDEALNSWLKGDITLNELVPGKKSYHDIIMAHNPAFGLLDMGGGNPTGSIALRDYVDYAAPRVVLCGHIHAEGTGGIGGLRLKGETYAGGIVNYTTQTGEITTVINPGALGENKTFVEIEYDQGLKTVWQYRLSPRGVELLNIFKYEG